MIARRRFLKGLLGAVAAVVVAPKAVPALLEALTPAAVVEDYIAIDWPVIDLAGPSMLIYPTYAPLGNAMQRLMLHEDRMIMLGEARTAELEANEAMSDAERWINERIDEVTG